MGTHEDVGRPQVSVRHRAWNAGGLVLLALGLGALALAVDGLIQDAIGVLVGIGQVDR